MSVAQYLYAFPADLQVWKAGSFSAQQTGAALWTPAAGKRIAITSLSLVPGGSVNGVVTVWFGAAGDTTYTFGTDQPVFVGTVDPLPVAGTNNAPAIILAPAVPIMCPSPDFILRVTTSAAIVLDAVAYGFEF